MKKSSIKYILGKQKRCLEVNLTLQMIIFKYYSVQEKNSNLINYNLESIKIDDCYNNNKGDIAILDNIDTSHSIEFINDLDQTDLSNLKNEDIRNILNYISKKEILGKVYFNNPGFIKKLSDIYQKIEFNNFLEFIEIFNKALVCGIIVEREVI